MSYFSEETSEQAVINRFEKCDDPRFVKIMEAAVRHLHGFVKEVQPTMNEWFAAIQFLTALGQKCDDKRQEWVLASDTLGVSMLVDAINHRRNGVATENTVLGPFYVDNSPARRMGDSICLDGKGELCTVTGRIASDDGRPIEGATVDVWQTNDDGFYDVQQPGLQPEYNMRGIFTAGADGRYFFKTVKPKPYSIPTDGPVGIMLKKMGRHAMRPAHIHFIVKAPGCETLVTHLFIAGDPYLDGDAVFGVKSSLIVDFKKDGGGWKADFDIRLKKQALAERLSKPDP